MSNGTVFANPLKNLHTYIGNFSNFSKSSYDVFSIDYRDTHNPFTNQADVSV